MEPQHDLQLNRRAIAVAGAVVAVVAVSAASAANGNRHRQRPRTASRRPGDPNLRLLPGEPALDVLD